MNENVFNLGFKTSKYSPSLFRKFKDIIANKVLFVDNFSVFSNYTKARSFGKIFQYLGLSVKMNKNDIIVDHEQYFEILLEICNMSRLK